MERRMVSTFRRPATKLKDSSNKRPSWSAIIRQVINGSAWYPNLLTIGSTEYGMFFVGLTAAVASSTFAFYMISHSEPTPSLFGTDHVVAFAKVTHSDGETGMAELVTAPHFSPDSQNIDLTTGSIPLKSVEQDIAPTTPVRSPDSTRSNPIELRFDDYVLRQVFHDRVMVSNGNHAYWIRPGSVLPGAGRVLSIERRGQKWTVITARGIIEGAHP
jgi:hypothetical protein